MSPLPRPLDACPPEPERPSATLARLQQDVRAVAQQHGVSGLRVFGAVVRGEDSPGTEVDLLVEHADGPFDPTPLREALEALLGVRVDLVSLQAVPWSVRERLLAQSTPI